MRDFDHRLGRRDRNFIILAESPEMVEPEKGTFHDPALGKLFPLARLDLL